MLAVYFKVQVDEELQVPVVFFRLFIHYGLEGLPFDEFRYDGPFSVDFGDLDYFGDVEFRLFDPGLVECLVQHICL